MKIKLPSPPKIKNIVIYEQLPTSSSKPQMNALLLVSAHHFGPFLSAHGVNRRKYRRLPWYACILQKATRATELKWVCMRLIRSCVELHHETVLGSKISG